MVKDSERAERERASKQLSHNHIVPNQRKVSTLLLSLIVLASLLLTQCLFSAPTPVLAQEPPIRFIQTVQVTPDGQFLTGSFPRINYVPATDRFVVSFGTKASTVTNVTLGAGYAYKEYNLNMQETGKSGLLEWYPNASEAGDSGSFMVNSTYYYVFVSQNAGDPYGWRIVKYDAANWSRLKEIYVILPKPLPGNNDSIEGNTDPMVAYVNGQLDVSNQYNPSGIWQEGFSSRHHFFTADLQPLGNITLDDSPHIDGSSIIYVDGIYYFVSADFYSGGLTLMKYDGQWNFLGNKSLIPKAHWSQGMAFDGAHFYVAYLDTSKRNGSAFFPVYPNVHLATFDRNWNLLHDATITNFTYGGDKKGGRPWVILHGGLLYVSYDVDTVNVTTWEEEKKWQAYVSIFEISQVTQGVPWPSLILAAGIMVVAVVAATELFLKRRERRIG